MIKVTTSDDVYPALKELISELRLIEGSHLADILEHRLFKVSWTTRSELFEELIKVLNDPELVSTKIPPSMKEQIKKIIEVIKASI